jgi:hypothetical protein
MNIELMEKIMLLVGGATESAVMIGVLWIVGSYLVTLIGWFATIYIIKFLIKTAYSYLTVDVDKETYAKIVTDGLIDKDRIRSLESERADTEATHRVELEKIKHLYKILKESGNVK